MISSDKVHMSSLVNSLNYRHSGRTLSTLPYNLVKNVKIKASENSDSWVHMVFSLDKKYLRNNALAFNEFKKSTMGQSMFKAFSFFIQLSYDIQTASNGADFACFLEWVKAKDVPGVDKEQVHVGIRVHVFSNWKATEKPNDLCDKMFLINRSQVINRKVEKNRMDHDGWKQITSRFEYARQVADVYTKTFEATSAMEQFDAFRNITHKANPKYVFRLDSNGFGIDSACDLQNKPANYKDDLGNIIFPDESRIYRMMPTDLMPDRFFFKYLPDYFFTRIKFPDAIVSTMIYIPETQERSFNLTIEPRLERERYIEYLNTESISRDGDTWTFDFKNKNTILSTLQESFVIFEKKDDEEVMPDVNGTGKWLLCQSKASYLRLYDETRTADAVPIVSPLINTLLTDKHSLSDIDVLKIRAEYKLGYIKDRRQFQEEMVQEFCERVWDDEEADISAPARAMILWKKHMRNGDHMNFQYKKLDPNMSIFANRAIRIMDFYEKSLFVSSAHKTLFLLNHAKYDAYRQETNLHFNQIYTGEGATSKSYMFEKMEEQSINGTVETLTYQTKRADAVDGDLIDTIQVFNEAPPGMFMTNANSDGEAEAMFKEKLTSMVVRCKEFYRDENTGERKNRIAKSQAIGVVMGATNDDPSSCNEAMATRLYWGQFEKVEGTGRSIQECMRGDRDMKTDEFAMMDKMRGIAYAKEEQLRMWLVFKFMFMKILYKPTLKAADIVYDQLSKHLKYKFKVNIPPRTKERYEILCTIYTIVNALEIVFNVEGGLHSGSPDQLDPNDPTKVLVKGIANVFSPDQLLDIEPYLFCTEEIAIFAFSQIQEEFVNPNEYKVLTSLWTIFNSNTKYLEERKQEDDVVVKINNYSYCQFNRFKRLLTEIANNIPISHGRMSKHNIQAMMNSLKDRTIDAHEYVNPADVIEAKYKDDKPQPKGKDTKKQFAVIVSPEGCFVHMDLFDEIRRGEYVNKVKEALKCLQHKYSYHYRNHMMGSNIRHESIIRYPNLFDTIVLERGRKTITMNNPLYIDKLTKTTRQRTVQSEKSKHRKVQIKLDLTIASAATHAKKMHIEPREFIGKYTEKMNDFTIVENCYSYPDDHINMYKTRNTENNDSEEYNEFDLDGITDDYEPASKRSRIV